MAELILNPLSRGTVSSNRRFVRLGGDTDLMALSGIEIRFLDFTYHNHVDLRIFRIHSRTILHPPWCSTSQVRIRNQNLYLRCKFVVNSVTVNHFD